MRVTWKTHPYDPSKNGTMEHVSRELAAVAVGYGQATYAPYKTYQERLSEAAAGAVAGNVDPNAVGVEWSVLDSDGSAWSTIRVCKKVGSTTTFYSAPPEDAPRVIVEKFDLLTNAGKNNPAEVLAKAKRDQAEYDARMKTARRF